MTMGQVELTLEIRSEDWSWAGAKNEGAGETSPWL